MITFFRGYPDFSGYPFFENLKLDFIKVTSGGEKYIILNAVVQNFDQKS